LPKLKIHYFSGDINQTILNKSTMPSSTIIVINVVLILLVAASTKASDNGTHGENKVGFGFSSSLTS
jgi:hypothetical protein